jgi:toxin ParE1/3/4
LISIVRKQRESSLQEFNAIAIANPLMGQQRDDFFPVLRQFTVRPYVVFYVPIENGIRVLRIIHGARDFPALFS